ncbi:MAG: hypothetical protein JXA15_02945 [Spirochaetales bacterium]|nr:hypothetical protein [Spirochaetales bacterium]
MTRSSRSRAAPIVLALMLVAPLRLGAEPRVSWSSSAPLPGDEFTVTVELPGIEPDELDVEAGTGAAGMEFLSSTTRPVRGDAPAARIELRYRVLAEGNLSTGPVTLRAGSQVWRLPAVLVQSASAASSPPRARATWIVPARVSRYGVFDVAVALPDGGEVEPEPFAAPGLSTFRAADGDLVALALDPGRIELPLVLPDLPGIGFEAAAIEVIEVPEAVRASRAVGRFSLRLEPVLSKTVAGDAFSFTLVLEGSGSLPVVVMPALSVEGPSGPVPDADLAVTRRDGLAATAGGFEGRVYLDCRVIAREAGAYRARFEPLDYLDPEGVARRLAVRPLSLEAAPRVDPAALSDAYARLESRLAGLEEGSESAVLARRAFADRELADDAAFAFGLHRAERSLSMFEPGLGEALAAALDAREAALRLPARPRDRLPRPRELLVVALGLLVAGFALLAAERRRARLRLRFGPVLRFRVSRPTFILLFLGLLLALAGGASLAERSRDFAVVWAGPVRAVPSESGGVAFSVDEPVASRVLAREGGWARVSFSDGRSGWVPDRSARNYGGF